MVFAPRVLSLVARGLTILRAKRTIEEALDTRRAVVLLPAVESSTALVRELAEAGFLASTMSSDTIDVKSIRSKLDLTQEQFAIRFGLDLDSVQNWEAGRRHPDPAVRSYLKVIQHLLEQVSAALEDTMPRPL